MSAHGIPNAVGAGFYFTGGSLRVVRKAAIGPASKTEFEILLRMTPMVGSAGSVDLLQARGR